MSELPCTTIFCVGPAMRTSRHVHLQAVQLLLQEATTEGNSTLGNTFCKPGTTILFQDGLVSLEFHCLCRRVRPSRGSIQCYNVCFPTFISLSRSKKCSRTQRTICRRSRDRAERAARAPHFEAKSEYLLRANLEGTQDTNPRAAVTTYVRCPTTHS